MVSNGNGISHTAFRRLAEFLAAGDVLVVNTSATVAAAVRGRRSGAITGHERSQSAVTVHFSAPNGNGLWIVELRDSRLQRVKNAHVGERIELPHGVALTLVRAWPDRGQDFGSRLWLAEVAVESGVHAYLRREGRPIAYHHVRGHWPLEYYQTIFAQHPGSAEMASASRPFSQRLVIDLQSRGIAVIPVLLHTGVSSLEPGETPLPERYEVSPATARRVNAARARGGRVIAAGTTVTRALETVARPDGSVSAGSGITELVIGPDRPPRVVDGLITGWHEPEASHLLLLEAVAGTEAVDRAYAAALDPANGGYLWHEFGDSCLFLR